MKQENRKAFLRFLSILFGLVLSVNAFAQIQVKGLVKDDLGESCDKEWRRSHSYRL